MNTSSLRPGQHLLSAAVNAADCLTAKTGKPPRLKKIAKVLGIRKRVLKAVIPDRDYLLCVMADTALQRLLHMIIREIAASSPSSPVRQLEAVAEAYIEWARLYPHEFLLLARMPTDLFRAHPQLLRYEQSIHEMVIKTLKRAQNEGYLAPDEDLEMLRAISHTHLYGIISKMTLGDLKRWTPGFDDPDAARAAVQMFNAKFFKERR